MSTNKSNKPELRFKGFSDDWEQRKLGELLSFLKDGTHGTHADVDDGPLLLSAKNIKNGGIYWDETDRRISYGEYEKIHSNFSLESGDVLLTIVGSIGETAILKDSEGITFQRSVAFLRPNNKITPDFLYSEIQTPIFQKELDSRKSTSAQPGIYLGDLAEIPLIFSRKIDEQKKIGEYFSNLDHLITLHQRKCDNLKIIKKSMLDNLFPKIGEKVPKWRFKGFNNDWEQRKLGDMTVELTEYETLKSGYPLLTSSRTGLMFQKDFRDKASTDNNSTKFSIVPYGKCTYRHMSDDNIFHFNINTIAENGLVSKEYPVFDANDNYNLKFIVDYLNNSKEFVRFCTQRKLGGTRTRLYYKNLCDFKMYVPQLEEQNIIAQHLKLLDNLITLHQSEVERLKKAKQFFLDKMFI